MTDNLTTVIDFFQSADLNRVGAEIIDNYKRSVSDLKIVKEKLGDAFIRRWHSGRLVYENYDAIIEECGTQRAFSEQLGITEAMLSNDLRGYKALLEAGITEESEVLPFLEKKNIPPFTKNWERLGRLLSEPDYMREKDQRSKDERRLEDIEQELTELRQRNESGSHNHIAQAASETLQEIKELKEHFNKLDPYSYKWDKQAYRQWACSLGWDFIMDEPCEITEFHHTDIKGGSGGEGKKLPDVFGLPTSQKVHSQIEQGAYRPTSTQIASGLIKLHSLFILNHWK